MARSSNSNRTFGKNVQRIGRWDLAGLITANLKHDIEDNNLVVNKKIGLMLERFVVKWIKRQPSLWSPLNPKYKQWKIKAGYSELTLRKTGTLVNNITSKATKDDIFCGVKREVKNKDGDSVANIAAIMEFGSVKRNIPPRPFLEPAMRWMGMKIRSEKIYEKYLMEHIRRKYGI